MMIRSFSGGQDPLIDPRSDDGLVLDWQNAQGVCPTAFGISDPDPPMPVRMIWCSAETDNISA